LLAKRGTVRLSAVSVWEIALLVDGRQVELDSPIEAWIARSSSALASSRRLSGIEPLAAAIGSISSSIAIRRIGLLIATAIELACPLVTYDERILRFAADYGGQYGFTARA
jgi:PIN domain nuclease of toxin-antitoxin system